jgi:hypothetical protein
VFVEFDAAEWAAFLRGVTEGEFHERRLSGLALEPTLV